MESERLSLRAAIKGEPGVQLHRLAYADWLEEHGEDTLAALHRWVAGMGGLPLYGIDPIYGRDERLALGLPQGYEWCLDWIQWELLPSSFFRSWEAAEEVCYTAWRLWQALLKRRLHIWDRRLWVYATAKGKPHAQGHHGHSSWAYIHRRTGRIIQMDSLIDLCWP